MSDPTIGNGTIQFRSAIPEKPEATTTTRAGDVDVNIVTEASPGIPAHFLVTHPITIASKKQGIETVNTIAWNTIVPADGSESPYREVEDAAAHLIAPALRDLADAIEAQVADDLQEKQSKQ
jgi:hypothetical protein